MNKNFPHALLITLVLLATSALPSPASAAAGPGPLSIFAFQASAAAKPSFDCKKAKTVDEIVICSDEALATLDRRLDKIYAVARAILSKLEKEAIIEAQRKWMADRNQACGNLNGVLPEQVTGCFSNQYRARIAALQTLLPQDNVIREIAGPEPWMEKHDSEVMDKCFSVSTAADMYYLQDSSPRYTLFLIGGVEYVFFNATFHASMRIPRGAYVEGEDPPDPIIDSFSCTVALPETAPASGEFSGTFYGWDGIHSIADVLKGYSGDKGYEGDWERRNEFARDLNRKIPFDNIILKKKTGAARHFRWDDSTHWYVESR